MNDVGYPTDVVRNKVHESGFAQCCSNRVFFENPLIGEIVGFEEISDRHVKIHFYQVSLGVIDMYTGKLLQYKNPKISSSLSGT